MKQIITLDKANKPYGFVQLDTNGNIPIPINLNSTASYAISASIANNAMSAATASFATSASMAAKAVYAENGTQWINTNSGIKYDGGSEVILGGVMNVGILTTAYNTNGYYNGYVNSAGDFDTLTSICPIITQSVYPNINNISRNSDYYSLKFEGHITLPTTDTYTFGLDSDDASDAFIDNTVVADWYGGHGGNGGPGGNQYPILLSAGKHTLLVRFQEVQGGDFVTLYYKTGSMNWTVVPDEWFSYGSGNTNLSITGSLIVVNGITGSLQGTASWAEYVVNGSTNIDTGSFATTGSNTFTSNQWVKGYIVFGENGQSSVDNADGGNSLVISARNNVTINTNNGDIILNPDGNVYKGSANPGNGLVTDGYLDSIIGDTGTVNNGTGHTITDNLNNIINSIPSITNLATTGSNIFNGNQTITGSIYAQSGSIIPEPVYSIDLTNTDYFIQSPGIYYVTTIAPFESNMIRFYYMESQTYIGAKITIFNLTDYTVSIGNERNSPYQKGSSTQITSISAHDVKQFVSTGEAWRSLS